MQGLVRWRNFRLWQLLVKLLQSLGARTLTTELMPAWLSLSTPHATL
jgi:hypothetical protein